MEELIKIYKQKDGSDVASARELHTFLGSKQDFSDWIKKRIEKYEFVENQDYVRFHKKKEANNATSIEYAITIDMAKELSMVEGNAKGKLARQYFIACEKRLKEIVKPKELSRKDLAMMIIQAEEEKEKAVAQLTEATRQIEADKPKVVFADAVSVSSDAILVGEMAKILKQNGVAIGQNRFFEWLRKNGYLIARSATDYNMPTQYAMEKKLFKIKETSIAHSDGRVTISKTPKITGVGQVHFINKFLSASQ